MNVPDAVETADAGVADEKAPPPPTRRAVGAALAVGALGLALDQGTKALAAARLTPGERVPLLGDLFGRSVVYNPGAAFSLGAGSTWIFTAAIGQGHVTDFLAYGSLFVGNIADVFVVAGVGLVCLNLASPRPGENHRVRNAQP